MITATGDGELPRMEVQLARIIPTRELEVRRIQTDETDTNAFLVGDGREISREGTFDILVGSREAVRPHPVRVARMGLGDTPPIIRVGAPPESLPHFLIIPPMLERNHSG